MRKQPVGWGVWHIGSTRRKRRQKGGFLRQNTISRSTARAALGALAVRKKKKMFGGKTTSPLLICVDKIYC